MQENTNIPHVSVFSPDFLLFALPFAATLDAVDIILEITSVVVVPKIIGIAIDILSFIIIGGWIYWRTSKIVKSKEAQKKALEKNLMQKTSQMEKQLAKGVKGPLRKTILRTGVSFLGELIPFVGIFPFWTVSVISTLREK